MEEEYEYYLYTKMFGEKMERRVSKEEWIKAERSAGFRPKCASSDPRYMTTCATGGFGSGVSGGTIKWNNPKAIPDPDTSVDDLLNEDYDLLDDLENGNIQARLEDQLREYKKLTNPKEMQYRAVVDTLLSTIEQISDSLGDVFPSVRGLYKSSLQFRNDAFEAIDNDE